MVSWLLRSVRPLVGSCLVVALFVVGAASAMAQSTMDPSIDSDGDGMNNAMDFDDDNDGHADNQDCAPFDPTRWDDCSSPDTGDPPLPGTDNPSPPDTDDPPAPPSSGNPPATATDDPPSPGASQEPDNDGDGIPDRVDPDDDNDGIVDEQDAAPFDPGAGAAPPPSIIDRDADSDSDGIANSHDPDDDNDGVTDDEDSHPFDSTRGETPPPTTIDPNVDSDGDGIANSHDPDDDNDGVVDELDCAPFDASVSVCPAATAPAGDGAAADSPGRARAGQRSLHVTSLPVTGTGGPQPVVSLGPVAAVAAIVAGAMLVVAGLRGWLRPIRVLSPRDRRRR